jgi:tol-pal system protein YbgF
LVPSSETPKVEQEMPAASLSVQAEEGLSAEAATSAVESEESPHPQVSRSGERSDKVEYERLLALFREGDLDGARQGFATFLRDYQNSDLSPNARFWLGESHYGKKDYRQAIDSYDRVELDFPQSEKVPSAILKKGYAYLAMKDKKRASSAFKQVVTLYPRSPEAGKASDKLSQLKESR